MNANGSLSAVLARHPEHIRRAVVVDHARGDEKEIREAVDVVDRFRVDRLAIDQFDDEPLGAPGDRPAEVERRGSRVAAGLRPRAMISLRREIGMVSSRNACSSLALHRRSS